MSSALPRFESRFFVSEGLIGFGFLEALFLLARLDQCVSFSQYLIYEICSRRLLASILMLRFMVIYEICFSTVYTHFVLCGFVLYSASYGVVQFCDNQIRVAISLPGRVNRRWIRGGFVPL